MSKTPFVASFAQATQSPCKIYSNFYKQGPTTIMLATHICRYRVISKISIGVVVV